MYQLQLAQERTDKLIIRVDPQLIEPMLDLRRHIFVKEAQRTKCQRQQHRAFYEFEHCDGEQSSAAAPMRSFFGNHPSQIRNVPTSRTALIEKEKAKSGIQEARKYRS